MYFFVVMGLPLFCKRTHAKSLEGRWFAIVGCFFATRIFSALYDFGREAFYNFLDVVSMIVVVVVVMMHRSSTHHL